jgi:hypothetical protein
MEVCSTAQIHGVPNTSQPNSKRQGSKRFPTHSTCGLNHRNYLHDQAVHTLVHIVKMKLELLEL